MCDACARAETRPLQHGIYMADCHGCSARMLAHGQDFWRSASTEQLLPAYRKLLEDTFGAQWQQWHGEVKRWAERIAAARVEIKEKA